MVKTSQGMSEKEIATALGVSPNTVRAHIENVKRKLQAKNKTHAVVICISRGFIQV